MGILWMSVVSFELFFATTLTMGHILKGKGIGMHFVDTPIEDCEFSLVCIVPSTTDSTVSFRIDQRDIARAVDANSICQVTMFSKRHQVTCVTTTAGSEFTLKIYNFTSTLDIGNYQCTHEDDEASLSLKADLVASEFGGFTVAHVGEEAIIRIPKYKLWYSWNCQSQKPCSVFTTYGRKLMTIIPINDNARLFAGITYSYHNEDLEFASVIRDPYQQRAQLQTKSEKLYIHLRNITENDGGIFLVKCECRSVAFRLEVEESEIKETPTAVNEWVVNGVIIGSVVLVAILIVLALCIFCRNKKQRNRRRKPSNTDSTTDMNGAQPTSVQSEHTYHELIARGPNQRRNTSTTLLDYEV
ncbi:hypothetical protein ScPMuIL_017221 [Solemya velum]